MSETLKERLYGRTHGAQAMIPESQLSKWEELAKAATKGPWEATLSDGRGTLAVLSGTTWICGELHNNFAMPLQEAVANADFIAIGPDNFLALIADLRDARKLASKLDDVACDLEAARFRESDLRAENERLRAVLWEATPELERFGDVAKPPIKGRVQRIARQAREALGSKK